LPRYRPDWETRSRACFRAQPASLLSPSRLCSGRSRMAPLTAPKEYPGDTGTRAVQERQASPQRFWRLACRSPFAWPGGVSPNRLPALRRSAAQRRPITARSRAGRRKWRICGATSRNACRTCSGRAGNTRAGCRSAPEQRCSRKPPALPPEPQAPSPACWIMCRRTTQERSRSMRIQPISWCFFPSSVSNSPAQLGRIQPGYEAAAKSDPQAPFPVRLYLPPRVMLPAPARAP
jgi:hypothetical protein